MNVEVKASQSLIIRTSTLGREDVSKSKRILTLAIGEDV
jgi:hypothetical protein